MKVERLEQIYQEAVDLRDVLRSGTISTNDALAVAERNLAELYASLRALTGDQLN